MQAMSFGMAPEKERSYEMAGKDVMMMAESLNIEKLSKKKEK